MEEFDFAKAILTQIERQDKVSTADKDKLWNKIAANTVPQKRKLNPLWIIGILLLIALGYMYFNYNSDSKTDDLIVLGDDLWVEYTNKTPNNWSIALSDGSQVILEPEAYLKYPNHFTGETRKVRLVGDAYFDIAHDTLKPFYVYANEAVVRVLGTSFHVKANADDKDINVIVETGKVAVYKGKEIKEYQSKKITKLEPLLVTPNQIATLQKSDLSLKKRLVTRPMITKPLQTIKKIHFENATIHEISEALEKAYGIEIKLDKNINSNCRLTTTLTDQPLFEKLRIICDPLGLQFIEKDVQIHIFGNCETISY